VGKRLLIWLTLLGLVLIIGRPYYPAVARAIYSSYCETPIRYRIDQVDPRFNLSSDQFRADVTQAEEIWEKAASYNLFQYDPQGPLSLNLVFDERQSLNNRLTELEEEVQKGQQDLKKEQEEYQKLENQFRAKLDAFNKEVNYWNSQGGAPFDQYDRLLSEQAALKVESDKLSALALRLNQDTDVYNSQVNQLGKTVDTYKDTLERKPEEGIFLADQNRIEIYFNVSKSELVHTIAHELGHAWGIQHNNDEASIMYEFTNKSLELSAADLGELNELCKKRTLLDRVAESTWYQSLTTKKAEETD
jgi:hypothetical protein